MRCSAELNYRNLDDEPDVRRHQHLHRGARAGGRRSAGRRGSTAGALGEGARELAGIVVTLHESHVAWASYERAL